MKNSTINILTLVLLLPILCFGLNKAFSQHKKVLPAPINTAEFTEYAPSVSADGSTLIFESDRQGDWKLFETHLNDKSWSVPIPIPKITTTFFEKAPLGGPCLSYDGNLLLFSANGKDSDGHEDIYYSIREKGGWSAPMNFGKPINTLDYEGYPSLSADGKYLYFARAEYIFDDKRDPQQRCYRIMRAERGTDGKWETAIELPSPVNLVCEKAPRIMPDGKTLMFSSIRKDGQGNFDIYKCTLQENGTWTDAVTLDFLNTSESDQFVAMPACGEMMYYVMDGDIYTATVPIEAVATIQVKLATDSYNLTIKVIDAETQEPIKEAVVRITDIKTVEIKEATKNKDNDFTANLKRSDFYEFNVKAEDYAASPDQKIDEAPEGNVINFTLSKKKRLPVHFVIFDVTTNKPLKASFRVRLEKEQKSFSFKDEIEGVVKVAEREIFTVETSADGYKSIQSTFNMADFSLNKKYLFPIRLEKALFVLNLKAINKITDEAVTIGDYGITNLTVKNNKLIGVKSILGDAMVSLMPENKYNLAIIAEGFEKKTDIQLIETKEPVIAKLSALSVNSKEKLPTFQGKNFEKIEKDKAIVLNNVYFEQSSFTMQKESYSGLDRVVLMLKTNLQTKIEIGGYTDSVGDQRLNLALSENRAKVILNYFVSKGIDEDRLLYKGYGGTKSVAPNDSEDNKKKNRRVEIVGVQ